MRLDTTAHSQLFSRKSTARKEVTSQRPTETAAARATVSTSPSTQTMPLKKMEAPASMCVRKVVGESTGTAADGQGARHRNDACAVDW